MKCAEKKRKILRKVLIRFPHLKEYLVQWCNNDINCVISFHVIAWILSSDTLKFYPSAHCIWGHFSWGDHAEVQLKSVGVRCPEEKTGSYLEKMSIINVIYTRSQIILVPESMPMEGKLGWKACLSVSRESGGHRAFWSSHSRKTISFHFPLVFSLGSTLQD